MVLQTSLASASYLLGYDQVDSLKAAAAMESGDSLRDRCTGLAHFRRRAGAPGRGRAAV